MSPDDGSLIDENGPNGEAPAPTGAISLDEGANEVDGVPEKVRVSAIVQAQLGGGVDAAKEKDCLVVLYTHEATLLGRSFVLDATPIRIGRGSENQIVLEGESVSRRHAHLEQRSGGWWCVDDGSTNGSYVNDEQIMREARLGNGDRIKIGRTILKFLSGQDVEAQYHEEIYRMTIIDGLTQVHSKKYLLESLDKETMRARRNARDLSFLMLDIDNFRKINEVHGHLAGDYVLKEVARLIQQGIGRDEALARYGGEEFAIVLPETHLEGARALAEGLRDKIEQNRFVFQGEVIRVTISIGGSILQDGDRGSLDLIKRADAKLYEAKRAGGNCVRVGPPIGYRPVLDGAAFLERMRLDGFVGALVAFEIEAETTIIEHFGVHTFEQWFRELLRTVELATQPGDTLGSWRDRYVLAAISPDTVDEVLSDVRAQWDALRLLPGQPSTVRRLRHASLSPDEVSKLGDSALFIVGDRLLRYLSDVMSSTFISYGGPDEAFARRLYEALRRNGVRVFYFPESAVPGDKLHRMMRKGVNDHDRVILVCSRASLDRRGVLNEIEETLAREAREGGEALLIPVTIDDYVFKEWAPKNADTAQSVRDRVVADFRGTDTDEGKFGAAVVKLLGALRKKALGV